MIPDPPAGTPRPVVEDSSKHLITSVPDVWRHYALPADVQVERVKEHR